MKNNATQVKPGHHPLSPAERTAQLLAFRGDHYNFTAGQRTASKQTPRATGAMRTA